MATYLIINLIVIAGLIPAVLKLRRKLDRRWWFGLVIIMLLTAVFDNFIVGLLIVGYDPSKILGIYVGAAPVEDFFYALAAMILVPALWERRNG